MSYLTSEAFLVVVKRKYLRGEHGDQRMYEARSRVKARINEQLAEEIDLFEETAPSVFDELRKSMCENDNR